MHQLDTTLRKLADVSEMLDGAATLLMSDNSLVKSDSTSTFNGTKGKWRRIGGMNLFLREGDGVIMNGPQALQGQPISNITPDDWRAIPHVRRLHEQKGAVATPGDDIMETSSRPFTAELQAEHAKAEVRKGFGKVVVTLWAKASKGRYVKVEDKTFEAKDEITAFENAKAWARRRLRAKGRARVKA